MRRFTVVLAVTLAVVALPMMAATTNWHYNENMNCSDCHSMHASAHSNLTTGAAITDPNGTYSSPNNVINPYYPAPNPGAGRSSLLKADDVCESCHKDQSFAPDVYGDNGNGYIRSAGGIREDATGGGHKIGSQILPPGYQTTFGVNYWPNGTTLECTSCHSPHGGVGFRNLVPYAMNTAALGGVSNSNVKPTVKKGTFDATFDVTILGADTYSFGSGNMQAYYGRQNVVYAKAATPLASFNGAQASNRLDNFCGVCHGAFHGGDKVNPDNVSKGGNASSAFLRHPTGQVVIGSFSTATSAANLKVYQAAATVSAATDSPGCLTCHKAHGNNNPFGLIYPSWTGADSTEEGNGEYKSLCKSCHGMGGTLP